MPKVNPDLLIHDDACHFEAYIKKSKVYKKAFRKVKHYIIDEFHRPNHKCKKRNLTLSEEASQACENEYGRDLQLLDSSEEFCAQLHGSSQSSLLGL